MTKQAHPATKKASPPPAAPPPPAPAPLSSPATRQEAERRILGALASLDDEAFAGLIVTVVHSWTQRAGGYRDKAGIAAVRAAIEAWLALVTG